MLAQYNLGIMYAMARRSSRLQRSCEVVSLAADKDSLLNQSWFMYKWKGSSRLSEAVKWYRLAAEQGDADAQYNLGIMYEMAKAFLKTTKKL